MVKNNRKHVEPFGKNTRNIPDICYNAVLLVGEFLPQIVDPFLEPFVDNKHIFSCNNGPTTMSNERNYNYNETH